MTISTVRWRRSSKPCSRETSQVTTPAAVDKEASRLFVDVAATPPHEASRGGDYACLKISPPAAASDPSQQRPGLTQAENRQSYLGQLWSMTARFFLNSGKNGRS
jgi:hypothetical protein